MLTNYALFSVHTDRFVGDKIGPTKFGYARRPDKKICRRYVIRQVNCPADMLVRFDFVADKSASVNIAFEGNRIR